MGPQAEEIREFLRSRSRWVLSPRDNEVTLGAGVNRVDGGWMGSISMTIANPAAERGPVAYYSAPGVVGVMDESLFTVDGDTAMYSGPMLKQPANDGSLPPPVEVGTGTVIATC